MSSMKDSLEEKLGSWFVDTYEEHPTHLVFRNDCSECYKEPPVVEYNKEEGIVLREKEEDNELPMFGIDLERLYESGRP